MPHEKLLTRWIVELPDEVFFGSAYASLPSFISLSEEYFKQGDAYFKRTQSMPREALSNDIFLFLNDQAKLLVGNVVKFQYYLLFDGCYDEVDHYYQRVMKCQYKGPELTNLFSKFYVYLDSETAKKFTAGLTMAAQAELPDIELIVYEATPQLVSGESPQNLPVQNYQLLMGIDDGWACLGGRGELANCLIIEEGWHVDNPELPDYIVNNQTRSTYETSGEERLIDGPLILGDTLHGTQTLGVLMARREYKAEKDTVGIVPEATISKLISTWNAPVNAPADFDPKPEAALLKAICKAAAGDVILIEQEWKSGNTPFECREIAWNLIWYATNCLDITIIEPAGNSVGIKENGTNIDSALPVQDSGAILVGAAYVDGDSFLNRRGFSARAMIDKRFCFAPVPVETIIDKPYGQTSAAAAVIAGIACQIQSIFRAEVRQSGSDRENEYLSPFALRELICGSISGVDVQIIDEPSLIGIIPNVSRILVSLKEMLRTQN